MSFKRFKIVFSRLCYATLVVILPTSGNDSNPRADAWGSAAARHCPALTLGVLPLRGTCAVAGRDS